MGEQIEYSAGDYVVSPMHGVGRVQGIETQEISGVTLELLLVTFEQDQMTLRVPMARAASSGLRKLSSRKLMKDALKILKDRSRANKLTMWSRRIQEYELKINSGDPVIIAGAVRDLHRGPEQPEQSFRQRQMYEAALKRLASEFAAVEDIDEGSASIKLEEMLAAA